MRWPPLLQYAGAARYSDCFPASARQAMLQEHPYALYPFFERLDDLLGPTYLGAAGGAGPGAGWGEERCAIFGKILLSRSVAEHIDRGLFNLVLGSADDLAPISLRIDGPLALPERALASACIEGGSAAEHPLSPAQLAASYGASPPVLTPALPRPQARWCACATCCRGVTHCPAAACWA